jgi:hypothetical protein
MTFSEHEWVGIKTAPFSVMPRFQPFFSLAALTVVILALGSVRAATDNLSTDWSDSSNPNAPWTYLVNGSAAAAGTRGQDTFLPPGPPPIWGSNFQGWSKDNGSQDTYLDIQPSDIYGHTPGGGGSIAIDWTSSIDGTIDLSGATWHLRDQFLDRANDWSLSVGGNVVASGILAAGIATVDQILGGSTSPV